MEGTGAKPAPCNFWQKALGRAAEAHLCSVFTIRKDSSLLQTGLLLNELEKPDLGYLCNICVAASDAQSRQSLKNDRGKIFPKDIKIRRDLLCNSFNVKLYIDQLERTWTKFSYMCSSEVTRVVRFSEISFSMN